MFKPTFAATYLSYLKLSSSPHRIFKNWKIFFLFHFSTTPLSLRIVCVRAHV